MSEHLGKSIAVIGATGLQGTPLTRRLLEEGWEVRAVTRDPESKRARALQAVGTHLVKADALDPASLDRAFSGVYGVYNVQNHHLSGYGGEILQGKNVVEAAKRAQVSHLVYASAGTGVKGTGIGSWETKVEVEAHARALDLPLTTLRPMAFMELMTERKFYPPVSVWHVMPKLMGETRPVGWLSVLDLAMIAAKAFADPDRFVGRDLMLASDVRPLAECREIWREVKGSRPQRFPMPVWMFERFSGTDETTMWRWLRANEFNLDTGPTLEIVPMALTVRQWLIQQTPAPRPSYSTPSRG